MHDKKVTARYRSEFPAACLNPVRVGERGQVFAGMKEIHDLHGKGEALPNQFPKGFAPLFSGGGQCRICKARQAGPGYFSSGGAVAAGDPAECWVIEDSKPGVVAGLAAGMRVIAITNTHPPEELGHATHVVRSYEEIERVLLPPM